MMREEIQVKIPSGMEASPVALLVQTANRYASRIYLEYDNVRVNAKSIMGMMSLGVDYEERVTVETEGEDEAAAMEAMKQFLSQSGQ